MRADELRERDEEFPEHFECFNLNKPTLKME
jgi:hypothetical protein